LKISDIAVLDDNDETGARNCRRICFGYASTQTGFEYIHGIVDKLMSKLGVNYYDQSHEDRNKGYYIEPSNAEYLFPDRQAHLVLFGRKAGVFGLVHPQVLEHFKISCLVSVAELDMEYIVELIKDGMLLQ